MWMVKFKTKTNARFNISNECKSHPCTELTTGGAMLDWPQITKWPPGLGGTGEPALNPFGLSPKHPWTSPRLVARDIKFSLAGMQPEVG